MTPTYLLYARSKRETIAADEIRLLQARVWCPMVLEGLPDPKRAGRKRLTIWTERAALPNYLFAELTDDQHHYVRRLCERGRNLVGFVTVVTPGAIAGMHRFVAECERAYAAAKRAKDAGECAPPQFRPGEVLEAVGGPLVGLMARYRAIVEEADGYAVEAETDLGRVRFNPADVRAVK